MISGHHPAYITMIPNMGFSRIWKPADRGQLSGQVRIQCEGPEKTSGHRSGPGDPVTGFCRTCRHLTIEAPKEKRQWKDIPHALHAFFAPFVLPDMPVIDPV